MYIYIKLKHERLAQKIPVAIAIVLSLEDEMLMVAVIMLAALFLAQSSSPSSHSIAPFHSSQGLRFEVYNLISARLNRT